MVEADVYRQMAITASMMAYSWSKWNGEVKNKKQIIVQGSEHLKDEHLLEVSDVVRGLGWRGCRVPGLVGL